MSNIENTTEIHGEKQNTLNNTNAEWKKELLKIQCEVAQLKCLVIKQCVTMLDLIDENREIKKMIKMGEKCNGREDGGNSCC